MEEQLRAEGLSLVHKGGRIRLGRDGARRFAEALDLVLFRGIRVAAAAGLEAEAFAGAVVIDGDFGRALVTRAQAVTIGITLARASESPLRVVAA